MKEIKTNYYWGDKQGSAIAAYNCVSTSYTHKNIIFEDYLYDPLIQISTIWVDTYIGKRHPDEIKSCVAHLSTILNKVDPSINNGFSYINYSARNWALLRSKQLQKEMYMYEEYIPDEEYHVEGAEDRYSLWQQVSSSLSTILRRYIVTNYYQEFHDSKGKNGTKVISITYDKLLGYIGGTTNISISSPKIKKLCGIIAYELESSNQHNNHINTYYQSSSLSPL